MGESPKPPLEYDRTATTVSVRGFRLLVLLTLINTALLVWFAIVGQQGPQFVRDAWHDWQRRREVRRQEAAVLAQQPKLMTHAFAPGTIVYTEDVTRAAALAKPGSAYYELRVSRATVQDWAAPVLLSPTKTWTDLKQLDRANHGFQISGMPIVFLHGRQTPGGQPRLVLVELAAQQRFDPASGQVDRVRTFRRIDAYAYKPFAAGTSASAVSTNLSLVLGGNDAQHVTRANDGSYTVTRPRPLTIYAGQPIRRTRLTSRSPTTSRGEPG